MHKHKYTKTEEAQELHHVLQCTTLIDNKEPFVFSHALFSVMEHLGHIVPANLCCPIFVITTHSCSLHQRHKPTVQKIRLSVKVTSAERISFHSIDPQD